MINRDEIELMNYLLAHNEYKKYCDSSLEIPKPYCFNKEKVKAIVLGADPSNKKCKRFKYVFGLENNKSPYFRNPLKNLNIVGIKIEDIYVQNVCRNYFYIIEENNKIGLETAKNKDWTNVAEMWIPLLKKELDNLFGKDVPVFITAEKIMKALCYRSIKPKETYETARFIDPSENKLGRLIIPIYRGGWGEKSYQLDNPKWSNYKEKIIQQFKTEL